MPLPTASASRMCTIRVAFVAVVVNAVAPSAAAALAAQGGAGADGNWTLVKLTEAAASRGAVCLDGSPAAFYIRTPLNQSASGDRQFVVFMEGGGWCMGDANCLQRAGTDLGSSKGYPATIGGAEGTGLYDTFATATVVYVKYCDGSSFTGDVADPVSVGGSTIYYRGRRILDAVFDDLFSNRGLDAATELLFCGCSAGALTTYVHADYVTALMAARAPSATVVALADAMFSLHHDAFPNVTDNYYTRQFTWGFTAWNSSASVNQACRAAFPSGADAWVCFHGAVAATFVTTPLFVANSKYDTWQRAGVLELNATDCPGSVAPDGTVQLCRAGAGPRVAQESAFWVAYGDAMVAAAQQLPRRHAVFLTNCPTHCETGWPGWANPALPGTRLDAAVKQWFRLAVAHGRDAGWEAPRWIARDGDKCAPVA